MNKKAVQIIFYVFAVIGFIVFIYHIIGIFYPSPLSPARRHVLFAILNIIGIYGLLKRPGWFLYFVVLLTIQQYYSHGGYAVHLWQTEHKIHWVSIGVLLLLPVLITLLYIDKRKLKP